MSAYGYPGLIVNPGSILSSVKREAR